MRAKRAARAEIVAKIDNAIENELIKRLQAGTYGDIYNIPIKEYNNVNIIKLYILNKRLNLEFGKRSAACERRK